MTDDWALRAHCRGLDPNKFFPPDGMRDRALREFIHAAQAVCEACPVRGECRTYARDNHIHYGVWGGVDMAHTKSRVGNTRPQVHKCAGGCGRIVATPSAWKPGYELHQAHGMCHPCADRAYRARQGKPSRDDIRAAHQEVVRQHQRGIPVAAISVNTGYSRRNVMRIINRHLGDARQRQPQIQMRTWSKTRIEQQQ